MKIARYDSLTHPITEMMGILIICLAILAGAWLVLQGKTHLLGIRMSRRPLETRLADAVLTACWPGLADPGPEVVRSFQPHSTATAAADRIYARLDREPAVRNPARSAAVVRGTAATWSSRTWVLPISRANWCSSEMSLRIAFGETLALVGPNGCGKSTLANLIPRFADPTSGEVSLDGVPLTAMRLRELRRQIGLVTQETAAVRRHDLQQHPLWPAARQSCRGDRRGQTGPRPSVHRQAKFPTVTRRWSARRAAGFPAASGSGSPWPAPSSRDPAILILDEATSQIDLESEQAIQQVLETFTRGRTTIIITHRMGVLTLADRIAVMQAGRIEDLGTHEELLSRCGLYRRLYQLQFDDLRRSA